MKPLDPTRRALLDAANRERTPDAATRARVLASLLAVGGSAAASSAKASAATAAAGSVKASLGVVHWLLLAGVAAAGLTSGYFLLSRTPTAREVRPTAAIRTAPVAAVSASTAVQAPAAPVVSSRAPLESARVPASKAPAAPSSTSGSPNALERELALLQSAHRAYRAGQTSKALQLAQEHGQLFPRSQLAAEGQTIEVLSLCALGRTGEARAVAGRLRAGSGSPSLAGLDASCVGK